MMKNGKIKSIERIEKKDGTVDFKLGIDDKLYILYNVEISQGNLEHNEDDSHSLSINFTFDDLDDKNFQKMNEDYVSFETAKLLKEKGFDESTSMVYMSYGELCKLDRFESIRNSNYNDITKSYFKYTAPTLQMAMKWLRETHNISVRARYDEVEDEKERIYCAWFFDILSMNPYKTLVEPEQGYSSYEEACEAAIKYCLENLI